jgi:hypothetical protein
MSDVNKDGDRTDYWAPDSSLNREEGDTGMMYTIADGYRCKIYVNDWVDLDPASMPDDDPLWGGSRQVLECQADAIIVRMWDASTDLYQPVAVSPQIVLNNYMHEPKVLIEG